MDARLVQSANAAGAFTGLSLTFWVASVFMAVQFAAMDDVPKHYVKFNILYSLFNLAGIIMSSMASFAVYEMQIRLKGPADDSVRAEAAALIKNGRTAELLAAIDPEHLAPAVKKLTATS